MKAFQPLVSIVIPVCNIQDYIAKCLDSIRNQTYTNLEVIVVDDGSTDGSSEIIANYVSMDGRFELISQENKGVSEARNTALTHIKGSYVLFVDGDDWLSLDTVEILVKHQSLVSSDLVLFSYVKEYAKFSEPKFVFEQSQSFDRIPTLQRKIVGLYRDELRKPQYADAISTVWGNMYKSSIILDNNLTFVDCAEIGSGEDVLFNLAYYNFVKTASYIHKCLYHYRKDNYRSHTKTYKPNFINQWSTLQEKIGQFIKESKGNQATFTEALDNRIAFSVVWLGINEMKAPVSFYTKLKNIKSIIANERYQNALSNLKFNFLAVHWKLFFYWVKRKNTLGIYFMLCLISYLLNRRN